MKIILKITTMMILFAAVAFTACDGGGGGGDGGGVKASVLTFDTAAAIGDVVTVTDVENAFNMIYANNSGTAVVFPTGEDDLSTGTIARKFFIAKTPVTNALFAEVLQWAFDNGKIVETPGAHNEVNTAVVRYGGQHLMFFIETGSKISYDTVTKTFSVASGYENHPVVRLTWYGAIMFCNWLTEMRDGNTDNVVYTIDPGIDSIWDHLETVEDASKTGYRLPSNSEYEYAARYIGTVAPTAGDLATEVIYNGKGGGFTTLTAGLYWMPGLYASGATKNYTNAAETRAVAWYSGDPGMGGSDKLMPVVQKTPNQLGLYDMSGNVYQWCNDQYWNGVKINRVVRGSSWKNGNNFMPVYLLNNWEPEWTLDNLGLRFARTK